MPRRPNHLLNYFETVFGITLDQMFERLHQTKYNSVRPLMPLEITDYRIFDTSSGLKIAYGKKDPEYERLLKDEGVISR